MSLFRPVLAILLAGLAFGKNPAASVRTSVEVTVGANDAQFLVNSADGRIRYDWMLAASADDGVAVLRATRDANTAAPITARYRLVWSAPARLVSSRIAADGDAAVLTQIFRVGNAFATAVLRGRIVDGALVLDLSVDRPLLAKWEARLEETPDIKQFAIPYNPVAVRRSVSTGTFASLFLDWMASAATQIDADGAIYAPRSDGSRNPAHERLVFPVSPRLEPVLPRPSATRSRYYHRMAGRVIIDVTETERFAELRRKLIALRDVGMTDCIVIVHVWQGMGYDNGLPTVLPANAFLGGEELLREIGGIVRAASCDFALHQNYTDYYPNSAGFDIALAARDAEGNPAKSWFNAAVGIGSYLTRPQSLVVLARANAPEIKKRLETTASFIDVNSAMPPWGKVDMDARARDGGKFAGFAREVRRLFAFMQDTEQGPVLGEGRDHFYWTGIVDGVEAEMRVGYQGDDVRLAPLWVDFDLRRMHPFQHNFGMGFYNRYAPDPNPIRDPMVNENTRDIYRAQQLAFAHLPYRSGSLWGDVRLYVQEAALAAPVARAYGDTAVREIRYRLGNRWVPIEMALPAAAGHAVRVHYANGLVVTANTGDTVVTDERGLVLPKGGWSAYGAGVDARSALTGRQRLDFMRSPDSFYADPRGVPGNWNTPTRGKAGLVDFGPVRTNGQTWLRCTGGYWTILGFAQRGSVSLEVKRSLIAAPARLSASGTSDIVPAAGSTPDTWRVELLSGRRYTIPIACPQ